MAINVTETAAREVRTIIQQQDLDPAETCLRVGVKGGGCSGFSYILDLTTTRKETDEIIDITYDFDDRPADDDATDAAGGVAVKSGGTFVLRVICDPKSYIYLNGTEIDFRDEIMGRGFVFNNPNASSSCGCGSSFAV